MNQMSKEEEHLNIYKSIDSIVNLISQVSQLQLNLLIKHNQDSNIIPNSARIIFFTPASYRNIEQIQDILNNAIINCNNSIEKNKK